jgi:hypothetical protein
MRDEYRLLFFWTCVVVGFLLWGVALVFAVTCAHR